MSEPHSRPRRTRRSGRESAQHRRERWERRAASVPQIRYPEHLPVVARRDEIAAAIRDHQVVVVAGETGSGKTTQLPKILLELGRGVRGMIGHTQPRRIAARSVAERLAEELGVELGGVVGYQVRFTDHTQRDTLVKVMTDGVLLAELSRDPDLRRYDTIVVDEAHERSLTIDFLLGYLTSLLPRRPDLKVIITSATIDPHRFAAHFAQPDGTPAPIIEVSGRTYPVQVRYRPLLRPGPPTAAGQPGPDVEVDQVTGILEAVEELWTEGPHGDGTGAHDILVFLSGEREIRDAADALTALRLPSTEIVPLYGRLSAAEQHRVFAPHTSRRVVLATNVAETSLTVPGIRYVVDTGTARISRYSQRTKVQRLPIEPISQASANQRSGRCGRLADGVAIRLYSEQDYDARPEFTEPEILRTNLASVILRMAALGLGDVAAFPFVEPPDARSIVDGVRLLEELRAVDTSDGHPRLTPDGRIIAELPVDPRLARMVIEGSRRGCLAQVLVVVAAMSIQDPRERPTEQGQEQAAAMHRRFAVKDSDFGSYLLLWDHLQEQQKALSGSAFRRMCKAEYLHYLRVREWQDLVEQLRQAVKQSRLEVPSRSRRPLATTDLDDLHQALLAGLLSHIGVRDEVRRDYLGARNARFSISPGSRLFRSQPDVVMAGELVETSRLWAHTCARIDPRWAERLGEHLVKRQYSEPRWAASQGQAVATERVTLHGVPLVAGRTVGLGRVDPELARELFIRHALVEGDWSTRHRFFADNAALLDRIEQLQARSRRRDILVGDDALFAFYDERIPAEIVSARHFDSWWKRESRSRPTLLTFTEDLITRDDAGSVSDSAYPTSWRQGDLALEVTYHFEPGAPEDGATVHVPAAVLNRVESRGFDWQVPGLREDLVAGLLRTLPKTTRRLLVPVAEHAAATVRHLQERGMGPQDGPLTDVLARVLRETHGVIIRPEDWDVDRLPSHLRMGFAIHDERGHVIARGTDLEGLRASAAPAVRRQISRAGAAITRESVRQWDFDEIPEVHESAHGGRSVVGYPALVDHGDSVSLQVLPSRAEADAEHRVGVRRLLLLAITPPWKHVLGRLTNAQKLALGHNPHGSVPGLLADCLEASVDAIVADHVERTPRTRGDHDAALSAVRTHLTSRVVQVVGLVEPVLARHLAIITRLDRLTAPAAAPLVADVRAQLGELIRPGFVADTGVARLSDLRRYLDAIIVRLDTAVDDLPRDAKRLQDVLAAESAYRDLLERLTPAARGSDQVSAIGWLIEELRVSLFAQRLGASGPVSLQRINRAIAAIPTGPGR